MGIKLVTKIIPATKTRNILIMMHTQSILIFIKIIDYQYNHNIEITEDNLVITKDL